MTRLPVLEKSDFSVHNFGRILRGYRVATKRIAQAEIARECSFRVYDQTDGFWGYSSSDIVMPVSIADAVRLAPFLLHLEDRRFYQHGGLDWRAFMRATVCNIRKGRITQGGSTISMQLVRNTLIEPHHSLLRKGVEIALARNIERRFTKDEILRLYCEQVFLGKGLRGFQSAAFFIYRKPIANLDNAEICGLLGLLRMPSRVNPYQSRAMYRHRQKFVSRLLLEHECDCPEPNPIRVSLMPRPRISRAIRREIKATISHKILSIKRVGTTLNSSMQKSMDALLYQASFFKNVAAVSAIVLDNKTGGLLAESAWERGREMEFSPALDGLIQPGSTFKTFALIAAIEQGITLDFPLMSMPFRSECIKDAGGSPWNVRNYGDVYRGEISLQNAFVCSDNCAFARLAEMLNYDRLSSVYRRFGVLADDEPAYFPIVLGSTRKGVSMTKLAMAYQAIANNGILRPRFNLVKYVESRNEGLAWTCPYRQEDMKTVISAENIVPIQRALRAAAHSYGMHDHWGKTGTTDSGRVLVAFGKKMTCIIFEARATVFPSQHERGDNKNVPFFRRIVNKLVS